MTMDCDEVRNRLTAIGGTESPALERHLAECAECERFARRFELARAALRDHRSDHQPDPYFAQRVSAALPAEPDPLGWAAVRLLPVALALTLVLTAWAWLTTPGPSALVEPAPTEDLLTWALEEDGS